MSFSSDRQSQLALRCSSITTLVTGWLYFEIVLVNISLIAIGILLTKTIKHWPKKRSPELLVLFLKYKLTNTFSESIEEEGRGSPRVRHKTFSEESKRYRLISTVHWCWYYKKYNLHIFVIEKYLVWWPLHHQFFHRHRPELALSIPGKATNNNNSGKSLNAFNR